MRKNRGKFNAMIESGSGSKSGTQKYQGLGHRKRIRPALGSGSGSESVSGT